MDTVFEQDNHMITFINGFEKGDSDYILAVDSPTRFYKAKFKRNHADNFVLKFTVENEDFNPEYFFKRPAILRASGMIDLFLLNSDAISFSQTLKEPFSIEVEYKSFSTEIDESKWAYSRHCAYFKYSKNDFRYTRLSLNYEITTNKNQHSPWKNAFIIKVSSQNEIMVSFEESLIGDDAYCVFRSQKAMNYQLFENIVKAVRTSIGILSGFFLGERVYYVSDYSNDKPKDKTPLIIRYRNTSRAVTHQYPLLDYRHYEDLDRKELELSASQFNNLVMLLAQNDDYLRAFTLLIDASLTEGAGRGAIASVALESIANNLREKGVASAIIQDTEIASQLKHELKKVLKIIKPRICKDAFSKIESKVNAINLQTNTDKLESCFEKLGIKLDDEELFCISCRNSFLHGGLPRNPSLDFLSKEELIFMVSQRLIMLSSMLILKQAGFEGMVNDWGYTMVIKRRAIRAGNPYLRSGNAHRRIK